MNGILKDSRRGKAPYDVFASLNWAALNALTLSAEELLKIEPLRPSPHSTSKRTEKLKSKATIATINLKNAGLEIPDWADASLHFAVQEDGTFVGDDL